MGLQPEIPSWESRWLSCILLIKVQCNDHSYVAPCHHTLYYPLYQGNHFCMATSLHILYYLLYQNDHSCMDPCLHTLYYSLYEGDDSCMATCFHTLYYSMNQGDYSCMDPCLHTLYYSMNQEITLCALFSHELSGFLWDSDFHGNSSFNQANATIKVSVKLSISVCNLIVFIIPLGW